MSAATELNLLLLRSVEKQTALYDRTDENYRKRLPSENAWDMVASEVGESVEKCKRRWRQLRNDYTRWCNADVNRRRNGQRRLAYPLADELRFLDRHLNIADDMAADDDRSVLSDKDRDNNRDSEGGDHHSQALLKERPSSTSKLVKEVKLASQVRKEKSQDKRENIENHGEKQQSRRKSAEEKLDELEESDEPEKVPELDSFLQSDNEDDECMDEEHLDDLEGFDFDLEQSNQEKEFTPEKSPAKNNTDSTVSRPEFFVKQNRDPRLLVIGRKNSTASFVESKASNSNSGDPLENAMEDSGDEYGRYGEKSVTGSDTISPSRRLRRKARASISSAGIKDLPIQKPDQDQRVTRLQRRISMSLAAVHRVRSSTSPVKMTPVPRSQPISKPPSGQVQIREVSHRDDIYPRPEVPAVVNINQNQIKTQQQEKPVIYPKTDAKIANPQGSAPPQRRSVGRPPKKLPVVQRIVSPETQTKPQSPINTKVLAVSKPTSSAASGSSHISNIAIKSNIVTSISNSTATTSTIAKGTTNNSIKTTENVNVISYSPNSSTTSCSSKATSGVSGAVITNIPTSTTAGTSVPVGKGMTQLKMAERSTQTGVPNPFSDNYFLEMIKPQMQEMNPRQKMHFKKKVFQALMETFDDATDFPTSKELQHFNINTPSGFEHITDPELRLVRELVSMVSAAKVTLIRPPGEATAIATASRSAIVPEAQRGTRPIVQRQVIQRAYKPGTGQEIVPTSPSGGLDKRLFRLAPISGKPNGNLSVPQEMLRKDSVDSNHSVVKVANNAPTVSPKGAAVVAAVRPQGSLINKFFGQGNVPTTAKGAASEKAYAISRRYSVCGSSNPPNAQNAGQGSANGSPINSNSSGMDASMLKRRLIAPGHGMVPPTQRPRYSTVAASQVVTASQGGSLLVRKSVGCVPAYQKQISPTGGGSLLQKIPQIASVQGSAFNDFVQPKAAATPSVNGEDSSPSSALKRSLVVANTKTSFQDLLQQPSQTLQRNKIESSETAATIAADDFSLENLKREPVDSAEDHNDILGI